MNGTKPDFHGQKPASGGEKSRKSPARALQTLAVIALLAIGAIVAIYAAPTSAPCPDNSGGGLVTLLYCQRP
jgi:hypothetical protein